MHVFGAVRLGRHVWCGSHGGLVGREEVSVELKVDTGGGEELRMWERREIRMVWLGLFLFYHKPLLSWKEAEHLME